MRDRGRETEGERDRDRHTETEREKEREPDRQTDRDRGTERDHIYQKGNMEVLYYNGYKQPEQTRRFYISRT